MAKLPPFGSRMKEAPQKLRDKRDVVRKAGIAVSKIVREFESAIKSGELIYIGPEKHEITEILYSGGGDDDDDQVDEVLNKSKIESVSVDDYVDKLMNKIPKELSTALSESDKNKFKNKIKGVLHFKARDVLMKEGKLSKE